MKRIAWWTSFQPIDLLLCTPGAWGCRFLTVTHRVIVSKVWDTRTFVALRAGADLDETHRASFEVASLPQRTLRFADLTASELFAVDLSKANLTGADLSEADITGAHLTFADLHGANLTGAHLTGAHLTDAHLYGADLTSANLTDAHLYGADLTSAGLTDANLTSADLSSALNLIQGQLNEACGTDTKLPPGLTLNKPCPGK